MIYIPEVSKEEKEQRAKTIKPVIMDKDVLMYIEPVDLDKVAYIWNPKVTIEAKNIIPCGDIRTYHAYAYYGFFKPSIGEVLAQVPKELLDVAVAFEIVKYPETASDLNEEKQALNDGYHVATTRFYKKG